MNKLSFKKIFARGCALAIPLCIVAYVIIKLVDAFEKIINPVATKLGIEKIFGEITLTVMALLLLMVLMFLLGLLMQFSIVAGFTKNLQDVILKFIPSLNHLKTMAAEKLDFDNTLNTWKPVLLFYENRYSPAFIIEENEHLITFFLTKGTSLNEGEILITDKNETVFLEITSKQMHQCSKQYGKGYLSLIKKMDVW
ncbi:MAG TPA: hypothetical protein PLA68_16600 [Panacibacter sp.]|nr:hypothetical protein [Panacibacter sp.]